KEKIFQVPDSTVYRTNDEFATRQAYGNAVASLAEKNDKVICLDAEVSNSTNTLEVKKVKPKQFIESYIAEQNMIGMATGLSVKGYKVFASTFGAFLTRAHDQIRMAALSNANLTICGSHAGVSIGEDGASQMALDDIAMMRGIPNSVIFYPSDAVSTEKLVFLSGELPGIKYIRTTRPKTRVLYDINEQFQLGDFKILKQSKEDKIVLAGSGITVHESLKAYEQIKKEKINSSVIDIYSIKPFNKEKFIDFVKSRGGKVIISEDHFAEGGIGEMISSLIVNTDIKLICLNIKEIPHSGKKEELLEKYRINAKAIAEEAKKLLE
ncbi:TPA: transketolase, partial [bacterium]|nr:transketolase [bacterium]